MCPIWTPAPSSAPAMRSGSSARVPESLFVRVEQTPGVLGGPEEVGGLLPARVLVGRHEDRSAVTRDDLDSMVTGSDAVDERWQRPARFIGAAGLLDVEGAVDVEGLGVEAPVDSRGGGVVDAASEAQAVYALAQVLDDGEP